MDALATGLPVVFYLWVFVVGAVVGSFLNVVIARVPKGESVVTPRSRCPRCQAAIAWYDNLPIVSWIVLRARCRRCRLPISGRYPLIELLTGVLAVAVTRQYGPTLVSVGYFAFVATLVALAWIDLDTWLLPHQMTWPLLGVGLLSFLWNPGLRFVESGLGAAAGFAFFAAIALVGEKLLKRETMGWGDVWLLAGIGAWLGLGALLPVILLSAVQGTIVGLLLIAIGRDPAKRAQEGAAAAPSPEPQPGHAESDDDWVPPKHAVPYGPFLALAALEQLLYGGQLAAWYDDLLRRLWA